MKFVGFDGKTEESQEANIKVQIISVFKGYFNNIEETQIHNYYISLQSAMKYI